MYSRQLVFCNMFSGSSPRLLGQHGSCTNAQWPVELSENMFNKLPPQTVQLRAALQYRFLIHRTEQELQY